MRNYYNFLFFILIITSLASCIYHNNSYQSQSTNCNGLVIAYTDNEKEVFDNHYVHYHSSGIIVKIPFFSTYQEVKVQ